MKTYKNCKVVMLPTNEKAPKIGMIGTTNKNKLSLVDKELIRIYNFPQEEGNFELKNPFNYLYFISDGKIKEGDWVIFNNKPILLKKEDIHSGMQERQKGIIIATTDSSLCYTNYKISPVPNFCDYPKPSQLFIEKYVEEYNKNNILTNVLVEYESPYVKGNYSNKCSICNEIFYNTDKLGFICSKHNYPKINPKDNTINIKLVKNSWNREEVINLIRKAIETEDIIEKDKKWMEDILDCVFYNIKEEEFNKWIEENL